MKAGERTSGYSSTLGNSRGPEILDTMLANSRESEILETFSEKQTSKE
jgi:hypothetical protein